MSNVYWYSIGQDITNHEYYEIWKNLGTQRIGLMGYVKSIEEASAIQRKLNQLERTKWFSLAG